MARCHATFMPPPNLEGNKVRLRMRACVYVCVCACVCMCVRARCGRCAHARSSSVVSRTHRLQFSHPFGANRAAEIVSRVIRIPEKLTVHILNESRSTRAGPDGPWNLERATALMKSGEHACVQAVCVRARLLLTAVFPPFRAERFWREVMEVEIDAACTSVLVITPAPCW